MVKKYATEFPDKTLDHKVIRPSFNKSPIYCQDFISGKFLSKLNYYKLFSRVIIKPCREKEADWEKRKDSQILNCLLKV